MVPRTSQGLAAQPLGDSGYRGKNAMGWLLILGVGMARVAHGRRDRVDGGAGEKLGGRGVWRKRFFSFVMTSCVLLWLSCWWCCLCSLEVTWLPRLPTQFCLVSWVGVLARSRTS